MTRRSRRAARKPAAAAPIAVAPGRARWGWGEWSLAALIALFVVLRCYRFHLGANDEAIYFYMSMRSVVVGAVPYRDYFFAHPPLHLFISILFLKMQALVQGGAAVAAPASWVDGGAALNVVKSIGVISGAVAGVFVYRAARRAAGPLEAVIACALFLLAIDVLRATFTGVMEAMMFTAIGLERALAGKDRQAGLALAAGCLVAMYVAPFGLAIWLVVLRISRRRAVTLAVWTAAPLLAVHGAFLAWAGRAYWEQVFAYHARKPKGGFGFAVNVVLTLYDNTLLVMALPAALGAALLRASGSSRQRWASLWQLADNPRGQLLACGCGGVSLTLLFIAVGKAVFRYYFNMLLIGLAPLAGLAYADLLRAAAATVRTVWRRSRAFDGSAARLALLAVLPIAGEVIAVLPPVRRQIMPDDVVGLTITHRWRSAPALGPINNIVRALCWRDEETVGHAYPVWTRYLWEASRRFDATLDLARYASSSLPETATLFGDSNVVPTLALRTGRRIALDEADTNSMRFTSGITPPESFIARLDREPPALVLFPADSLASLGPELTAWMLKRFEVSPVRDRDGGAYLILRPNGAGPL